MPPFDVALPSTEELFSVIEAIHDNVAIVDHNGVMRWVSSCFERTYGVSRDRIIGRTTYELEAERVFSPSVAALVLKTRRVVTLTEVTRSGRYNIVTGVPIYGDDGDVSFVVSYSVDMRYSRQLHEEYQKINALLSPAVETPSGGQAFGGTMRAIAATLEKLARVDTTVLITGESGVGKNVVARLAHHLSDRAEGPLVEINCAGIPAPLLESELFGYEAGAFTGASHKGKEGRIALADKGTLFLDEIGELPLLLQAKLLRALQQGEVQRVGSDTPIIVDVRVIAATNRNLREEVGEGRFREDLYYRLNVIGVEVPPLRERREDIPVLATAFLERFALANRKEIKGFTPQAMDALLKYGWPGNVRELENAVERAAILCLGEYVSERELPMAVSAALKNGEPVPIAESGATGDEASGMTLDELERAAILRTLQETGDNKSEAARRLGITRATLHNKLRRYDME